MGGTIAITLRKPDGTEYRMDRWTNITPFYLSNIRLAEENETHIQEFLKEWFLMKDDYERHKDDKQFEQNMTDVYFPSQGLVPVGYGLIIIDMKNKIILDCFQNYTTLGNLTTIRFIRNTDPKSSSPKEIQEAAAQFQEPFEKKRIKRFWEYIEEEKTGKLKDVDIPLSSTFQAFKEAMITHPYAYIDLDLTPYTIERFKSDSKGFEQTLKRIRFLGFVLTQEEERLWQVAITDQKEVEKK